MMTNRAEQILDYAERQIRKNGFDGVSFRDIADAIGIKSASVHYHFPTKADLGAEVTRRYAQRFVASLGAPDDPSDNAKLRMERLADGYVSAYRTDGSTCLCAVLGAVASHLPEATSQQVRLFYSDLHTWLRKSLAGQKTTLTPNIVIGVLQGAMVLSLTTNDETPLLEAKAHVVSLAQ